MSLKALITKEDWEKLDSKLQSEYTEKDGKHLLDVTSVDGWALEDVTTLKSSLQKERSNAATGSSRVKELEAQFKDIDPIKAREALAKIAELADYDPDKKLAEAKKEFEASLVAKFDKDKATLLAKHTTDMDTKQKDYEVVAAQLRESLVDAEATRAVSEAKGSVELLNPIIRQTVSMKKQDDGTYKPAILDGEGNPRLSPRSGSTEWMTISEYVNELKENEVFARAFDGSGASGSGATGGQTGKPGSPFRISATSARDPAQYRAAKETADKAGRTLEIGE